MAVKLRPPLAALQVAARHRLHFHELRQTHATLLLKAGVHRTVVSERLGHASIDITLDTYCPVTRACRRRPTLVHSFGH